MLYYERKASITGMSTAKTKNTGSPRNVPEAVTHLRKQLKLSREKFGARIGCSLQTVVRWEAGKAKINYMNLLKLATLARELDPISLSIFENEIGSHGSINPGFAAAIGGTAGVSAATGERLRTLKTTLDEVQQLLDKKQNTRAASRLRKARNDFQSWLDGSHQPTANKG